MPAPASLQSDYHIERVVSGGVTYITLHGTLNEAFDSRKLAATVRTNKLLVNMSNVRRFSSWGMSEWMDFLRATADCDVYLIECSSYAIGQLNLITGLLGQSKLVSFYVDFDCTACGQEMSSRFVIPRNRATIREIPTHYMVCPSCGGNAKHDEYPAAFFEAIAARPAFDIDDEALAFMRTKLKYELSPDLTRFRAHRKVQKDYTYLRLTGNIATMPADTVARAVTNSTVIDLAGIVFEPDQTSAFQSFLLQAKPNAKSISLLDCPPRFLDATLTPTDLDDKLNVRTFDVLHRCGMCDALNTQIVDVAPNLEQLTSGQLPVAYCSSCRSPLVPVLDPDDVELLRALPARNRDPVFDAFIVKCRTEPPEKLENCLIGIPTTTAPPPRTKRRNIYVGAGLAAGVLVSTLLVVLITRWSQPSQIVAPPDPVTVPAPAPFKRPPWIQSDAPASGSCYDMNDRVTCVGVSSYRQSRDDGAAEASDAALEALVNEIALKIQSPYFREAIMPGYSSIRTRALSALQNAHANRDEDPKAAATHDEAVRAVRKRVVNVLQSTGGAAVPAQRSDWYWEEYENRAGGKNEFLVFVRFDVTREARTALVEKYSQTSSALGATVMTAFPALAWQMPAFSGGGALVTKAGRLAGSGIGPNQIVVAVGDTRVADASSFLREVQSSTSEFKLTVVAGDAPEKVVHVKQ